MVFRNLIGRTIATVSLATALVAVAVALDLPRAGTPLGGRHGADGHANGAHAEDAAHAPVTSEAAFVAGMIPHHQEAVEVALEVLARGERPEVRALAAEIASTQQSEIDRLRGWLAAWYPDEPPAPYQPMMRRLEGLRPGEVDQVFVADMIRHHEMAIGMAEEVLALDPAPRSEIADLARDVIRVQTEEIDTLRGWLADWSTPAAPRAP